MARRDLGRRFGWLWAAYAVSAYGTGLGFGAFPLIAITVLHSGPAAVSALSAAGRAVGAALAVPLGPWVEFRRKRPVMIGMDVARFAAMLSIPVAYALGVLTFVQLLVVSMVAAAGKIAFDAASGAYLKSVVAPADLIVASGRFESTTWSSIMLGPPLGGAAIGLLGPVATVLADAVSYLLSAAGIGAIRDREPRPERTGGTRLRPADLLDGWRFLLTHSTLRPLLVNSMLVNGLIMATEPLISVLMLGELHFAPWQFGLAFAVPCIGGLIGSRLASRLVERFGRHRVLRTAGVLRACWLVGLTFVGPGTPGLVLVMAVELGMIVCMSLYGPVMSAYRLEQAPQDRVARALSAWQVSTSAAIAVLTAVWGVLAAFTGPRVAIAIAGVLSLVTPVLLPRREPVSV